MTHRPSLFPIPLFANRTESAARSFDPLASFWEQWGSRSALDTRLSVGLLRELDGISGESDPELRREALGAWAQRVERAGHPDIAFALYSSLLGDPALSEAESVRLNGHRDMLEGRGPWAARLEQQASHLTQEVLSPSSLLAMGAAGAVFRMTRLAMLTRLGLSPAGFLTRGRAASVLASFSGFLLEAPAFSLSSQAFRSLGGAPLPTAAEFAGDVGRGYLTLGGLRLGGGLSQGLARSLGLSSSSLLQPLLRQSGMFGGILMGSMAEESLGFHPLRSGEDRLFDSLALLLHFNISGRLVHEAFGSNFRTWESSLDQQSHRIVHAPRLRSPSASALRDILLSPLWLAMGAGGLGGGVGSPRSRQLHLPFPVREASAANSAPPLFTAPDLAAAETLRQASPEAWRQGMETLRRQGHLRSEVEEVSWIRELRLSAGISRLGEIFRAQGQASNAAGEALRELANQDRPAVLRELQSALNAARPLAGIQALQHLTELQAQEALPGIQALRSGRPSALSAAAEVARLRLGDESLIPELQARARNPRESDMDRIVAWEALGQRGAHDVSVEALRRFFRRFHRPETQVRAALALTRLGANAAVLSFESRLEWGSDRDRAEFAEAFFELGTPHRALEIWRDLAASTATEGRQAAIRLAATYPQAEMIPILQALRADPYPEIRRAAGLRLVEVAGHLGDRPVLQSLLEATEASSLRESEALQVRAASQLLAGGENAAARERLETYLGSNFGEIRLQAASALLSHGESRPASETLWALTQAPEGALRHRAARRWLDLSRPQTEPTALRFGSGAVMLGLASLTWLLQPALAEASTGLGSGESSWWLPVLMTGGLAAAVRVGRSGRSSEPPASDSRPPQEPFAWFENPLQAGEIFPLPELSEAVTTIGRSTTEAENVFSSEQRQISRRHMDTRLREGRLEIRVHNGSRGIRVNEVNLLPFQWYRLRDQDLVEFVAESRTDIPAFQKDAEGTLVQGLLRLGQRPVEAVDAGAIFRFRLGRPMDTPIPPRPRRNILERVGALFRAGGDPEPSEAPAVPEAPPVRSAERETEEVYGEIMRLSHILGTPLGLLEASLRSPDWIHPDVDMANRSRRDVLTALIRVHSQLCGNTTQRVPVRIADSGAPVIVRSVRVPSWDGLLAQRLEHYENGLRQIEEQRGASLIGDQARDELHRIRDRLNRLFEMVRLFRRHFRDPEELAQFDAIENAYRGIRPELLQHGERVRSMTRGLDATVRPSDRQVWSEEFLETTPSSRAAINMRILLGEIREFHGRPLVGSFYQSLSSGTLYEGRRSVRFYFDRSSGQILGFEDGSSATDTAIRRLRSEQIAVEEGLLMVDANGSGRITEVSLLGPARESVTLGLLGLQGLRVLPPQVLIGWNGHAGDEGLQAYRLQLIPDFESPREEWYRIAGLIEDFEGGQSLITVEPLQAGGGRRGVQVLVPRLDAVGIAVDDVLTVSPVSP